MPGPAVGFLQEAVRWWDYWLKGEENGVMDGPMLRAWEQDSMPPNRTYENRPGRWVGEQTWPSPHIEDVCYTLASHRLVPEHSPVQDTSARQQAILEVRSPLSLGINAGKWCSYAATPDLPGDQREEDGGALAFETRPLSQGLHIFGQPGPGVRRMTRCRPWRCPRAAHRYRWSSCSPANTNGGCCANWPTT